MYAKIAGTGSFLPKRVVTNDEIAEHVETSDEWIVSRTGVRTRHVVEEETAVSMAIAASENALENSGVNPEEIDLIIVSTVSTEQSLPCVACEVQAAIGAVHAMCFDMNVACAGFITAYQVALAQMEAGFVKKALTVGSESLSHIVDWKDRGTCILFGDGAGAAVVVAEESEESNRVILHADGSRGHVLSCKAGQNIQMDGREVFKFAVREVPNVIQEILKKQNLEAEEIDYYVLHQANERIIEAVAKRLKVDMSHFPCNVDQYGNMSSASIPVLLDELNRSGKLKRGMKLILAGFGAGLTWGGTCLKW